MSWMTLITLITVYINNKSYIKTIETIKIHIKQQKLTKITVSTDYTTNKQAKDINIRDINSKTPAFTLLYISQKGFKLIKMDYLV